MVFQIKLLKSVLNIPFSVINQLNEWILNRFKFHGCIEVNTLTQWCTFVCDFSKVRLFLSASLYVHCTWYTNVQTFDLAVTNYLLQYSTRVYKTCFIKLFSCDKICTIKCEEKKTVRIGLQTTSSAWTWSWRHKRDWGIESGYITVMFIIELYR